MKALSPNHWTTREFPIWFHLDEISRTGKSTETERRLVVARVERRRHGEYRVWGFIFGVLEVKLDQGGGCTTL